MVDKSEKFEWLVRLGYFSRAILYSVIGIIALTSAGQISQGTNGVFQAVQNFPAGTAILWLMVVGLFGYGLFRLCSPIFDIEHEGSDLKGWGKRLGHLGSAVGHFALAYAAFQFATSGSSSGGGAQDAASTVLSMEFGGLVLGLLGLAFFLAAISQAKKGITGSFMHYVSGQAPSQTRLLGSIGFLARAAVFVVIGWSLVQAGFMSSGSDQVKSVGGAVASLADDGAVFTAVAIGLLAFGLLSFILARYRIIPEIDSSSGVPNFRA